MASAVNLRSYQKSTAKQGQTEFSEQTGKLSVYKRHASPEQQNQIYYEFNHAYCWKDFKVVMF